MKYLLSIIFCFCLSFSAKAQNTYHSMLEGNPEWGYPSVEEESYTTFKKEDPFFDGEVNGIDRVLDDTPSSKPSDSAIYDLTGRRLNGKPERGIYIQGGKKYIIK